MPSFISGSGTCSMQSISYGSKTRPLDGISWRPTSWRTFTRLSRTIRTPSPAFPSSATTAASISSRTGRSRESRSSWANLTTISAAVHPLAVVLELRLEILQLRQEILVLATQLGEFIAGGGLVVRLVLVLHRGSLLVHLRYLS